MNELLKKAGEYPYLFAIFTDGADFITPDALTEERLASLLELRCFGPRGEYRARRETVDRTFAERELLTDAGSFAQWQYLDIDEAASKLLPAGVKKTTRGGTFRLPRGAENATKILVRFYNTFDADGTARVSDWRLCGFDTDREPAGGAL